MRPRSRRSLDHGIVGLEFVMGDGGKWLVLREAQHEGVFAAP